MNIIKPLHIACNQQVLEHNNQFHCIVSATMGVRLSTGEALLEFDFYKEAFACMGDNPLPDLAMPKPQAEYIVSGSYHSPGGKDITAGEVLVRVGDKEKKLHIFGARQWTVGLPSKPETFTSIPLSYTLAYGGNGFENNPDGMGYDDSNLPLIENPNQLLTSNKQKIQPAGLSPMSPAWPQRMRFQGTYDETYLTKYYPGYPEDFDWNFFMTTAQDQWLDGYFNGNEAFEFHNLHPDKPVISGKLPGYLVRCFVKHGQPDEHQQFIELHLNLDTLWFFPEADLALIISRGGMQVKDDDATQITDMLLAFESPGEPPRDMEYHQAALNRRLQSDDALLNNFNTSDLIPAGVKCAMEILQENAFEGSETSPFEENLDAKTKAVQALVDDKLQDLTSEYDSNMEAADEKQKRELLDLRKSLEKLPESKSDADLVALNQQLEAILPGITAGDASKLKLTEFSFGKIDELMSVIDKFRDDKIDLAMKEVEKTNKALEQQIVEASGNMDELATESLEKDKVLLDQLNLAPDQQDAVMPRFNMREVQDSMTQLNPQIAEAMQQMQSMKAMGADDESTRELEKMIEELMQQQEAGATQPLDEAEKDLKELYRTTAHGLPHCKSPHNESIDEVKEKFINRLNKLQKVSDMDWACLDLSGVILDGIDMSGAYLEQVDFTNASLKDCNLKGAILSRAILDNADLSGANLENSNLGSVSARQANFSRTMVKGTILSKGNFSNSNFDSSHLEEIEMLEIKVDGADFSHCKMEKMQFINTDFRGTVFKNALLNESVFLQCNISVADFSGATMQRCVWSNTNLKNVIFDAADMTSNCFAATEDESVVLEATSFKGSCLEKVNFQGITMPKADFKDAILTGANFSLADASYADFSNTSARQAFFRKATLTFCNFDKANVMEGSMAKAQLSGASFVGANLYAVDFLRSTLGETDFSRANLDNTILRDWRPS